MHLKTTSSLCASWHQASQRYDKTLIDWFDWKHLNSNDWSLGKQWILFPENVNVSRDEVLHSCLKETDLAVSLGHWVLVLLWKYFKTNGDSQTTCACIWNVITSVWVVNPYPYRDPYSFFLSHQPSELAWWPTFLVVIWVVQTRVQN